MWCKQFTAFNTFNERNCWFQNTWYGDALATEEIGRMFHRIVDKCYLDNRPRTTNCSQALLIVLNFSLLQIILKAASIKRDVSDQVKIGTGFFLKAAPV